MEWDRAEFGERVRRLEAMASYKWDEYGNFRPGVKFLESLAAWLNQMENQQDRTVALEFVLERLLFVSGSEMTHLIELAYPDHIEQALLARVAKSLDIPRYQVRSLVSSELFRSLRRRSLILGASDGARLDRLRRSAPFLSHEQFLQSSRPPESLVEPMCGKLKKALDDLGLQAPATFAHVFLVDDFSGSGTTMLEVDDGVPKGKLEKLRGALEDLEQRGLVAADAEVTVVLYFASEQAMRQIRGALSAQQLPWELRVVQELLADLRVDRADPEMAELSERYYDKELSDEHKGDARLGFAGCALPVVLSHNTPNNSISLLWGDTRDVPESLHRYALFPRYERHHRDRP